MSSFQGVLKLRRIRSFASLALRAAIGVSVLLNIESALAAGPKITGPIPGAPTAIVSTKFDLSQVGYQQSEFFMSGTAKSYTSSAPLSTGGDWNVTASSTSPYTTRVIVYRPTDPDRFNGTVYVEWINVSSGADFAPEWMYVHDEVIDEGAAYVLVSAQQIGVNVAATKEAARYGSLKHPGDSFSYDIYSQAGEAIKRPASTLLGGLKLRRLIAVGESQSANRLVIYIDAVQPLAHIYDGFFVHSYIVAAAPLSQAPQAALPAPAGTLIRTDQVPVLNVQTETDALRLPANVNLQPDDKLLRIWDVPGAAHGDAYLLANSFTDIGDSFVTAQNIFTSMLNPSPDTPFGKCAAPIDSGPHFYVINAALAHLNRWVKGGAAPPLAPRFEYAAGSGSPVTLAYDVNGNVRGGIRTPFVDVPVARLSGAAIEGSPQFCGLFGSTTPFGQSQLSQLYPSHDAFVSQFAAATVRSAREGWILTRHVPALINAALQATTVH